MGSVGREDIEKMARAGETETLEFKKSTAQRVRAVQTLCALLNGNGGHVVIGVAPDGRIVGQDISEKTLRDLAELLGKLEPPGNITLSRCSRRQTQRSACA